MRVRFPHCEPNIREVRTQAQARIGMIKRSEPTGLGTHRA